MHATLVKGAPPRPHSSYISGSQTHPSRSKAMTEGREDEEEEDEEDEAMEEDKTKAKEEAAVRESRVLRLARDSTKAKPSCNLTRIYLLPWPVQ